VSAVHYALLERALIFDEEFAEFEPFIFVGAQVRQIDSIVELLNLHCDIFTL
jgi:hypothetical protein